MSKLFYDHIIVVEEIDMIVVDNTSSPEEKEELWKLLDEIIHHRVIGCCLYHLPEEEHECFLDKLESTPYEVEVLEYVQTKTEGDIEEEIKKEILLLKEEILGDLKEKK